MRSGKAQVDRLGIRGAARLQASLLARRCPECDCASVSVLYEPADGPGGDFYDIIPGGSDLRWFLIGDVCGHGVPSALVMALVLGYVWGTASSSAEPTEVARRLNEFLLMHERRISVCQLLTSLFLGILDVPTLTMRYINAGHPAPLVQRHSMRRTEVLSQAGVLLGVVEDADWIEAVVAFEPGDRLILYSDGITDARDASGEMLGTDGLRDLLDGLFDQENSIVVQRLSERLRCPSKPARLQDDRTLVLVKFAGVPDR